VSPFGGDAELFETVLAAAVEAAFGDAAEDVAFTREPSARLVAG
jgi:hypothetical protein